MPGKSITGLSWFVVLVIARLPSGFWMSQAQTDPKRPAAAWLNWVCIAFTDPKLLSTVISSRDALLFAHSGAWARMEALDSLRWPFLYEPAIHGPAVAVSVHQQ
jgi:hypothetical protein